MKICPQCNKTYNDETLNFCLEDGTVLTKAQNTSSAAVDPPPTVMIGQPQQTTPNQPFGSQPTQPNWSNTPNYQASPSGSSSKTWLWALGVIGAVILLCGGGFVGIALLIPTDDSSLVPDNDNTSIATNKKDDDQNLNDNRKLVTTINFKDWNINENEYISADIEDGALTLTSKKGYYYVVLTKDIKTYNSSTLLTLKNTNGGQSAFGYGLVIHSDPKAVLTKDYAFLIRTDTRKYRIVRHTNKRETDVIPWTNSSAIKSGSLMNELEVRVKDKELKFYINGTFVDSIKDFTGYKDGVAGIYTSDDAPIAFQKLEIRR